MKLARSYISLFFFTSVAIVLFIASAFENDRVYEKNIFLEDGFWSKTQKIPFEFEITDTNGVYDFHTNLRIAATYPYSNIFILVYAYNPDGRLTKELVEFKLAEDNGKWLGHGLGDVYDYRMINDRFKEVEVKKLGKYRFEFRQMMRTETLRGVKAVGLRVSHHKL